MGFDGDEYLIPRAMGIVDLFQFKFISTTSVEILIAIVGVAF